MFKTPHIDRLRKMNSTTNGSAQLGRKRLLPGIASSEHKKRNHICNIVSESNLFQGSDDKMSHPFYILRSMLDKKNVSYEIRNSLLSPDFFIENTNEHIASYKYDIINAIRSRDIQTLREMVKNGRSMHACNQFGESIIHMACRRGFTDVVKFLLVEAGVSLRVIDDFGRTPLHDACWVPRPSFDLVDMLLNHEPELLLMSDKRGHTPLDYVRKEHWKDWREYLLQRFDQSTLSN
mmetsp:Transcript_265/g.417  ORF Transcript_265/g.417 Transcript_265/m.417 type:complete len:235 (-) Transcript_265:78-782(-)